MTPHKLSKWCGSRCSCIIIRLQFNNCRNHWFRCHLLLISFMWVVGCVPPSQLCQFVKLRPLLPKPRHPLLYRDGDSAHHPAGFVIFAQLALLCLFFILIFPILPNVGTCKIAQTVSDCHHHLLSHLFRHSGCQFRIFSCRCVFLLLPDRCLCIFNTVSCHSGLSLHMILDPLHFLVIAYDVHFWSFLRLKLLSGSQAMQCPNGSNSFCFQATLAFIRLMTSSCGPLCRFAVYTHRKWWKDPFRSIDHCSLCWLCCWVRC